jgi:hypothetical protein
LWAQEYALANREEMMDRVIDELSWLFFVKPDVRPDAQGTE